MTTDSSNLRTLPRGAHIDAEHYAAVTRAARHKVRGLEGYSDDDYSVFANKPRNMRRPIQVHTDVLIPKYSVFALAAEPSRSGSTVYVARQLSFNSVTASPLLLATNHEIEIPANTDGWCHLFNHDDPFPVRFAGTAPMVGHWCGLEFDSFDVVDHRTGLTCVSKPEQLDFGYDYGYADEQLIEVVRAREPIRIVGEVVEKITSFADGQMGKGKIVIKYRESTYNELLPAYAPNDGYAFEVEVFNFSTVEFEVSSTVSATDTLGIGLTVDVVETDIRVRITETLGYDPVAIYASSHPTGFLVRRVDANGVEFSSEFTAYADELINVHWTGRIVRVKQVGSKWQVITTGVNYWEQAILQDADGITGDATNSKLFYDGPVAPISAQWSLPVDVITEVLFDDEQQKFIAFSPRCAPVAL